MKTSNTEPSIKYTHIDLTLARAYYPILVEFVDRYRNLPPEGRAEWQTTYGDLIARAKERFPDDPAVQSATSINTGRRLGVIRQIANGDCPDMSCLVFNKTSSEVGSAYQKEFDPAVERAKLLEEFYRNTFDFHNFKDEFFSRVDTLRNSLPAEIDHPKKKSQVVGNSKKISEEDAGKLRHQYYSQHKANLPKTIKLERDTILNEIMDGIPVDIAFQNAVTRLELQASPSSESAKKASK